MRTNIVLNDELVAEAMKYSRSTSKTALVEEALRAFVEMRSAEKRRTTYEHRLAELREKLGQVKLRESSRTIVRRDREQG